MGCYIERQEISSMKFKRAITTVTLLGVQHSTGSRRATCTTYVYSYGIVLMKDEKKGKMWTLWGKLFQIGI